MFRLGDPEAIKAANVEAVRIARQRDKDQNKGFFDSEAQRRRGLRGGAAGGSKNTEEQTRARRKVGLTYGRTNGMQNQSGTLKENIACCSIWSHGGNFYFVT